MSRRRRAESDIESWIAVRRQMNAHSRTLSARSEREALAFFLAPHQGALYLERIRFCNKTRAVVALQFADGESFQSWCDADDLRFTYPILFAHLKRSASDLFDAA